MERRVRTIPMGEGAVRYRVTILDDPSAPGSREEWLWRARFLQEFAAQPALWECGTQQFTKMVMKHDGTRWIIELEAEEKKEP